MLASITLITLDTRGGSSGVTAKIRNGVRDVFAPVQDGVDSATRPISDWWDGVTRSGQIKAENRKLRRELQQARGQVTQAQAALHDNRELRRLANLTFVGDLKGVTAQIILGSPGNFESTVALDKGTDSGVAVDQPVVSGLGLLGRIARASGKRSTVLLLTDPDSGVNVRDTRTNQRGIINGRPDTELQSLDNLDGPGEVKTADILVTAGTDGGPFPPGIPVGQVVTASRGPGDVEPHITVRLFADASTTEFVRILEWPVP